MRGLLQNYFNNFTKKINFTDGQNVKFNFEQFLSDECMQKCIQNFSAIKIQKLKSIEKTASVLIPLCHVNNELSLLYTQRTATLRRHKRQISFPGGMCDENETVEETALRETEEEVRIRKSDIKIYGSGSSFERLGVLITPVVGYIGHIIPANLDINKHEVELAFTLPLFKFCNINNCRYTKFRNSYTLPVFIIDGYRIWGITGHITHIFLKCLLPDVYKFDINR